jgi:recombinational DNA repair protein RecR
MDIVERLRKLPAAISEKNAAQTIYEVSEDAISEIERLREALKDINENMRQADRYFLKESTMAALKGDE